MTTWRRFGPIGLLIISAVSCGENDMITPGCTNDSKKDCTTESGATGEQYCTAGVWGPCQEKGCTENATLACTQPNGQPGQQVCQGGKWTACSPIPGQCQPGTYIDCTTSDGKSGKRQCDASGNWGDCQPGEAPPCTEGDTQGCTQSNGQPGQRVCQGGTWTACSPVPGKCQPETYRDCITTDNKPGFQQCDANGDWGPCQIKDPPICQNGDTQACSTACGTGTEVCINEQWLNCSAPLPQTEICDGLDNNCNGQVDEVCTCIHNTCEVCYTGAPGTQGVGPCKEGTTCCTNGSWGPCQGQVLPAAQDTCSDAIDNDCNGAVNDGCVCIVGQQQMCGTNVGECVAGIQTCQLQGGLEVWGPCMNSITPQSEANFGCDGKDNDCDGEVDEGIGADNLESNDTCIQARGYSITDTDTNPQVVTASINPSGDVDYFRITAVESDAIYLPPCCFWPICDEPSEQCNFLEVELIPPAGNPMQYQFSLLTGNCSAPTQTFVSTSKKLIQWTGLCGLDDTQDFWVRVEPKVGTYPTTSCANYTLKFVYWRNNDPCP